MRININININNINNNNHNIVAQRREHGIVGRVHVLNDLSLTRHSPNAEIKLLGVQTLHHA